MNQATDSFIRSNAGLGAKAIAEALALDPMLVRNIMTADLAPYLVQSRLRSKIKAELAKPAPPGLEPLFEALGDLDFICYTHKFIGTAENLLDTLEFHQMLGALEWLGVMAVDEYEHILSLGGGFRYDRLTTEAVQAVLDSMAAEAADAERDAEDEATRVAQVAQLDAMRDWLRNSYNAAVSAIDAGELDRAQIMKLFEGN